MATPQQQQQGQGAHPHLADYQVGTAISKGAFGTVYKAVRKSDGRVFALKQVNLTNLSRVERQEAIDEARILAQLNHPHVIRHYDSFIDSDNRLNILMEYAAGGDLAHMLKRTPGRPLQEDSIWKLLIQTLLGLNHIHGKKIIHRDIKALNILFDSMGNAKIGDFGIARMLSAMSNFAQSKVGTVYYLSPELCEDKPYNAKSDVWALGVVLYECMMGKYPFDAQNEGALIRKIVMGKYQPISGPFSSNLIQLATSCLTFRPESRPDTNQLLRNPAIIAKAKALGIDLNPRAAPEDPPMYEQLAPAGSPAAGPGPAGPYQQHAQGSPYAPGAGRPGSAGPGGRPQQPGQAYGSPYQSPQAAAYGSPSPGGHPFAMAGPGPGPGGGAAPYPGNYYPGSPSPAGGPHQQLYAAAQGYGSPAGGQYGSPRPGGGQQQGYYGPQQGYGQASPPPQPQQPAYVPQGNKNPDNPWDNLADDINRIQISESERARNNADRIQNLQANVHAGQRDNLKALMYNAPHDSGPRVKRPDPAQMPPAGGRPPSAHSGAPFAMHYGGQVSYETVGQSSMQDAWRTAYQPPQYGRRRCPELQITGPSLRGTSAHGGGGGTSGRYAPAADDATTYVSTSYAASYYK